jgi:hypothetical protein
VFTDVRSCHRVALRTKKPAHAAERFVTFAEADATWLVLGTIDATGTASG